MEEDWNWSLALTKGGEDMFLSSCGRKKGHCSPHRELVLVETVGEERELHS